MGGSGRQGRSARALAGAVAASLALTGAMTARASDSAPADMPAPASRPDPAQPRPQSGTGALQADRAATAESVPIAATEGRDLAEVRRRLVAQLERAAEAGLITLQPVPGGIEAAPAPAPAPPTRRSRAPEPTPEDGRPEASQAAVASPRSKAFADRPDRDPAAAPPRARGPNAASPARSPAPPATCPEPETLDLPARHALADPAAELARLRRGLLGEFDAPRAGAANDLARFYLTVGLTAEARAVLEAFAEPGPEQDTLVWMAGVLGSGPAAPWPDQECDDLAALWRAAAAAERGEIERALALARRSGRALQRVAPSLRQDFAGRLGHAAADIGDWAGAMRFHALARRSVPRSVPDPSSLIDLSARIALSAGRVDDGLRHLRRLWARYPADPAAGEAILSLARLVMSGDVPGAEDTAELRRDLGSLSLLARGTPAGSTAAALESRLAARAFGKTTGMDLLALHRRQGTVSEPVYARTVNAITAESGDAGQDPPLALMFSRGPERFSPVLDDPAFRSALALSFARIGQPGRAEQVLEPQERALPRVAGALAEAYLDAGRPSAAASMAARLPEGERKAVILARALAAQGRPDRALAVLSASGVDRPELSARLAWAARDWRAAAATLARLAETSPRPDVRARLATARQRAGSLDPGPELAPGSEPGAMRAEARLAPYLDNLKTEIDSIREVLGDG